MKLAAVLVIFLVSAEAAAQATAPGACGKPVEVPACGESQRCEPGPVFAVPDAWHGLVGCLRGLRDIWARGGPDAAVALGQGSSMPVATLVRRQVEAELGNPRVRVDPAEALKSALADERRNTERLDLKGRIERVALLNDRGRPYNAMGQAGLSYILYNLSGLAAQSRYPLAAEDSALFRAVARGALQVVVADVSQGGLASRRACEPNSAQRCAWYHSITRRDQPTQAGATLNQHLHVVRDLGLSADYLAARGWDEGIDFDRAVAEGLNQLFIGRGDEAPGSPPDLADFLSPPLGKAGARRAYYGFNTLAQNKQRGYFLDKGSKDCGYHFHVLVLFGQILKRAEQRGEMAGLQNKVFACGSPLAELHRAAVLCRDDAHVEPRPNIGGGDFPCPAQEPPPADRQYMKYLDDRFSRCARGEDAAPAGMNELGPVQSPPKAP
ncbi:hypothetical protein OOT46_13870 [Aquabacterium sp. A7-Y]|uniref:hypothetical protein n=1 Tax=Aquabacterium sp. A7-Y TaxID=1349605 RepID=UPI00223D8D8A|nr:hypothetical protein [Aquabacterium sp. A7-Y]MCW7538929.1 hypothetical protein [Aquabacterium sp. A7-Y]